jgi:thymidylate kinase
MTVNVIQKMRIYNSLKETEIVIMDQGLIQACVSLSTNGKIRAKENYERLLTMMPNAANASKIYIDVNDETALDRMSQRATNDSRVEKLKDMDAKKEMLNRIRCEMTHLRELWEDSGNDIVIVSSNDLKEDIDATYDAITKTLNEKNYKK